MTRLDFDVKFSVKNKNNTITQRERWICKTQMPFMLCMSGMVIVTGYTAINAVVKAELFPAHIRALGVALPYAIANTIFGGTAELVALSFKNAGHENYFFYYITFMIGLSLLTYIFMKDTKKHSMITDH